MSASSYPKYTDEFKKSIVTLHQNGKSLTQLSKEYGISMSALSRWVRLYSEVKIDEDTVVTAHQIKELQKRNTQLEEENLILKKAIAIFTPHSNFTNFPLLFPYYALRFDTDFYNIYTPNSAVHNLT